MGLFSKKKRVSTATQTLSLLADTPDVVQQSVTYSVLTGSDVSTDMMNTMLGLFKHKVARYYRYGRDHFTNGLPEGTITGTAINETALLSVLDTVTPTLTGYLTVYTSRLDGGYDEVFHASEWMRTNTQWDPDTNVLPADNPFSTQPVTWLPDLTAIVSAAQLSVTAYTGVDPTINHITINITPKYSPDESKYYYYVTYNEYDSSDSKVGYSWYWTYILGEGTYPTLDTVDTGTIDQQYLPIVPLRINNVSLTDEAHMDTPLYKTSKALLNRIDLKIGALDKGVNDNPDIKEVDHAYVLFGVDVKQDTADVNEYLFKYFNQLVDVSLYTQADYLEWEASATKTSPPSTNQIKISDGTYNSTLNYYYAVKQDVVGNFGKVGSYRKFINPDQGTISAPGYDYESVDNQIIVDHQVTDTLYQRITIAGVSQTVKIYAGANHVITLSSAESEVILVPLLVSILDTMKPLVANTLAYHSMKIVFQSYVIKYLKWYQTMLFTFIIIVVTIVISVIFPPSSPFLAKLAAAYAAGAVALMIFIAQTIAVSLAIHYGFKYVASKVGAEFAAILAAIALVYGMSSYSNMNLPYADSVLSVTTPMYQAINAEQQAEIKELQNDYSGFMNEYKKQQKEMEDRWKELQPPFQLDPLQFYVDTDMPIFESPSQYIARKSTTNVADITGYAAIQSYFDNQLSLT